MANHKDTKPNQASIHRTPSLMAASATGAVAACISQFEATDNNENARPGSSRASGKKRQTLATHQEDPLESPAGLVTAETLKKDATPEKTSLLRSALRGSPFRRTPTSPSGPPKKDSQNKPLDNSDPFSFIPRSSLSARFTTPEKGEPQLTRVDSSQSDSKPSSPFGSLSSRLADIRNRLVSPSNSNSKATPSNQDTEPPSPVPIKHKARARPSDNPPSKFAQFTRANEDIEAPSAITVGYKLTAPPFGNPPSKSPEFTRSNDEVGLPPTPVKSDPTPLSFNSPRSKLSYFTHSTGDTEPPSPIPVKHRSRPSDPPHSKKPAFDDTFAPLSPIPDQRKLSPHAARLDKPLPPTPSLTTPSPVAPPIRPAKQETIMAEGNASDGGFALPRLEDLLRTPEDLEKIPALKAEYTRKKAAIDAQFREGFREQLESVHRGIAALAEGQRHLGKTRDEMQNIDKLCAESQTTVGDFSQIDKLARIHRNFEAVIMMKKGLESFPQELVEVEGLLREDDEDLENQPNLLNAHMALGKLRDFRDEAMDQIRRAGDRDGEANLTALFQDLDPVIEWFEDHIGTLCMNLIPLIQSENNGMVVRLAIVIRKEEQNDEQVRALQEAQKDHKGLADRFRSMNIGPKTVRGYKENMLKSIELYAQSQFEDTKEAFLDDPDKLTKSFRWFFNDLMAVKQGLQRCMPKKWNIYKTYTNIYHRMMHDWLVEFVDDPQLPAANMLAIIHWSGKYYEKMAKLGWTQADLVPNVLDDREGELVRDWRNLIVNALDEWMDRMFATDKKSFLDRDADALDTNADGYFRTKTLGDMWRMIHEQLLAAGASDRTDVAEGVVDAMFRALRARQSVWQTILDEDCAKYKNPTAEQSEGLQQLQDWLIAVANDQIACIDDNEALDSLGYLTRFRRDLEPLVSQKYLASHVEPEIESLRDGYVDLSTHCITLFIDLIFAVDFRTTLPEFFTQRWYGEFAMKRMVSTFDDYMADYSGVLHPSLRDILIEEISDELLVHYLSAIRNKGAKFRRQDPFTDKFKDDVLTIFGFFRQFPESFAAEGGIKDRWRLVDWLVRLLEADKASVVTVYEAFKTEYWDLQLTWVEAVLRSRDDFERSMISAIKARSAELTVERGPESIMGRVR